MADAPLLSGAMPQPQGGGTFSPPEGGAEHLAEHLSWRFFQVLNRRRLEIRTPATLNL